MNRIGACSWSLRASGPDDLASKVRACGLDAVQIALDLIRRGEWGEPETIAQLESAGIALLSGMMAMCGEDYSTLESIRRTGGLRLDAHWPKNLAAAHANAKLAQRLGISLVTFHAGFLPHDPADRFRRVMIDRLRQIADAFAQQKIAVAFETGQETADTLVGVLRELNHPTIGVNFDPANMILYGMGDPIAALRTLTPWVRQVHIKDAIPSATLGTWGPERPVGQGSVDWPAFLQLISECCPNVNLIIERESGEHAIEDIRAAHQLIQRIAGRQSSIVNRQS